MSNQYSELAKLITVRDLLAFKEPRWLINGFIHENEIGFLWGEPNCGKTFVALDWALSIASGKRWLGVYDVLTGPVVYMAGEGAGGLQKRIHAWMEKHGEQDILGAYFIVRALPL